MPANSRTLVLLWGHHLWDSQAIIKWLEEGLRAGERPEVGWRWLSPILMPSVFLLLQTAGGLQWLLSVCSVCPSGCRVTRTHWSSIASEDHQAPCASSLHPLSANSSRLLPTTHLSILILTRLVLETCQVGEAKFELRSLGEAASTLSTWSRLWQGQ